MRKIRISQLIRHNNYIYHCFAFLGKASLNILKLFVKPDDKLILFNSFGGKKYDDSPKEIYERMIKDDRFKSYRLVWAFSNPQSFPEVKNKIKSDGIDYFITALKARCWVSNTSIQRGIDFKGKRTISFNTWHGSPIKKMGIDVSQSYDNTIIKNNDLILAQSQYDVETLSKAWKIPRDRFSVSGLPRNDYLAKNHDDIKEIRQKLGISDGKKIILNAPTYRDYALDRFSQICMVPPIDFEYWQQQLQKEWVVIIRAHYEVTNALKLSQNPMWIDLSNYPSLNELMIISDLMISDYSSVIIDYSILAKPILGFTYDYDEYERKRGLYFDVRQYLSCFNDGNRLVDYINEMDHKNEKKKTMELRKKFVEQFGSATENAVDLIWENL